MKPDLIPDTSLIARCGLYCGACKAYLKGKCKGCAENHKAAWCKVRLCCIENQYKSCADCKQFANPDDCKKFNNFMSKLIGLVLNSDRKSCIRLIKETGYDSYAMKMASEKRQTLKRRN